MDERPRYFLSPAKINLFLAVTGKRPDGYHDLVSLMCPIDLADTIKIEPKRQNITVSCSHVKVPADETNLAHRAAVMFLGRWAKEKKGRPFGLHIDIDKQIPVAAGLGGGSSNAATILLALNRLCGQPYTKNDLAVMAVKLGADVPFFIFQQPAVATGIGEILQPVGEILHGFTIILIHPSIEISTANVYQSLNLRLTKCPQHLKNLNLCVEGDLKDPYLNGGLDGSPDGVEKYLCNDLETVTLSRHPEIEKIKGTLSACGSNGTLMSGSGPTVFGLFKDVIAAKRVFRHLTETVPWRVYLTEPWSGEKARGQVKRSGEKK